MTGGDQPRALRRWLRRPLIWALGVALFGALFVAIEYSDARADRRLRDRAVWVVGRIEPVWDHGQTVPVSYRDPSTGTLRRRTVTVLDGRPARIGPIELLVDPDDPSKVVAGPDRYEQGTILDLALLWFVPALGCAGWAVTRRRRFAWARRTMADPSLPSYRMVATPRRGAVLGRRWRLDVYAVDSVAGDPAACTVPVVGHPLVDGVRVVDVKGSPRPGGALVVREPGTGIVWWPASRALLAGRAPRPPSEAPPSPNRRPASGWWLLGAGLTAVVVSFAIAAEQPEDVDARSRPVDALVTSSMERDEGEVAMSYRVDGRVRRATAHLAGPQLEGDRLRLRVDRDHPDRLWQPGIESPPGTKDDGWGIGLFVLGLVFLALAPMALRRSRPTPVRRLVAAADDAGAVPWAGFVPAGGRLWFGLVPVIGPPGRWLASVPLLRFETDGLVVVHRNGTEEAQPWSAHWAVIGAGRPSWWLAEPGPGCVQVRTTSSWPVGEPIRGQASRAAVDLAARAAADPDLRLQLGSPDGVRAVLAQLSEHNF